MIENISKVLEKNLCDHCLGRLYSRLLTGMTNEERGKAIRKFAAMMIDAKVIDNPDIDFNNFHGFKFRNNEREIKKGKCSLCSNLFDKLDSFAEKAYKKTNRLEFESFLVGSKISDDIFKKEEKLWEVTGIELVESIKSEINRELGKKIWDLNKKPVNFKKPDILIVANFVNNKIEIKINSLYVLGYYNKLKRGIPQSKWGTPGKYKTSVQEIIAKPFMKATKGKSNSFHGSGREDIDATCLGWRPFVFEVIEPLKRKINLKEIEKQINKSKKVKVKIIKFCDKDTVIKVKEGRGDKTYRALVKLSKPVGKKELGKLKELKVSISQRTPIRVSHRRADLIRRRKVKEISYKQINSKTLEIKVKGAAGLYIKELVTGDKGRTKPSVAEKLGCEAVVKELDVIKIERPKNL
ncbi:MAG: tRNA pseudouridine(54/55) synthase Pus10 [Candidatus Aenigmatarchaeota archaeon]